MNRVFCGADLPAKPIGPFLGWLVPFFYGPKKPKKVQKRASKAVMLSQKRTAAEHKKTGGGPPVFR
jgi:hypothetical protein